MESFLKKEDKNCNFATRWDRIEKRHIDSASIRDRTDAGAAEICKNLIQNKEFITNQHLKRLLGEIPKRFGLDPNLVMDMRHSGVRFFILENYILLRDSHYPK